MHAHESHPDDETLFDLIEGALDEARAREIEAHLDACASCGALVQASLDGSPDSGPAIVPMSSDAVDALDGAITSAWRARTKVIAAHEAADDLLAPTPFPDMPAATTPIVPLPARPARAGRRGGFRAWAVPAFALIVLSVLGGTSLMIDRDSGVTSATKDRGRAGRGRWRWRSGRDWRARLRRAWDAPGPRA